MGKTFVICEVKETEFEGVYIPAGKPYDGFTQIDSCHVIDEDRLREATPLAGDRYFCPKVGWTIAPMNSPITALILDPPKLEGDQFWTWADGHPNPNDERFWNTGERKFNLNNYYRACKAWLAKMPRKQP